MPERTELREIVERMTSIHDKIAADVPQIGRGMVWCTVCGRSQRVNGAECLRSGWPKCCGYTMTIDSPAERHALEGQKQCARG